MNSKTAAIIRRQSRQMGVPYRMVKRAWATMTPKRRGKLRQEWKETK